MTEHHDGGELTPDFPISSSTWSVTVELDCAVLLRVSYPADTVAVPQQPVASAPAAAEPDSYCYCCCYYYCCCYWWTVRWRYWVEMLQPPSELMLPSAAVTAVTDLTDLPDLIHQMDYIAPLDRVPAYAASVLLGWLVDWLLQMLNLYPAFSKGVVVPTVVVGVLQGWTSLPLPLPHSCSYSA